tara:strand:+ start:353 stop:511 length:159 start_codon:yes stop_codon:yes gene_type:complete
LLLLLAFVIPLYIYNQNYYDPAPIIVLTVDPLESNMFKVTALTNSVDDTVFA